MLLTELSQSAGADLPIAALKDHLRIGSAFGADTLQDGLIESHLRAAIAAIEARIGKVLLTRRYRLTLADWRGLSEQPLPLAPVSAVISAVMFDANDTEIPVSAFKLIQDTHRPKLVARGTLFAHVPTDGRVEITFDAGFGPVWGDVPADLAHAVILLAAVYYDQRHDLAAMAQGLPQPVQVLIERWRNVRVLGGGAA